MRTQNAPTIRLKNYTPPAFTISKVDLDVQLDPHATRVISKISVERARGTKAGTALHLDGDELTFKAMHIDGIEAGPKDYQIKPDGLALLNTPKTKTFELTVETELSPVTNRKLMGLYQSSGVFCTQCEAEGFRRITYFLDRPDVLAVYTVRLQAEAAACPVLLSNGNLIESGTLPDGQHYATWHDPHPKPSYLFAMVGGKLDALSDTFTTASGRAVDLNIYFEPGKATLATYAMDALKRSMVWDEERYGCEYDLDVFNIVAVSDFNMGAMENKGLNVFNDKYVLADPNLATDADYGNIEAIIAHEYFHNWTGNRITCRDWFQLCLKEGLTVYRDQEFSADMRSRAVQRIQQVRGLKAGQFPEDAGPLAHSVRPEAYREINNFYTATVYQKGAELVRMLATLVGSKAYRKSTDLYFKRHDGEAAVVEDWLKSFDDAAVSKNPQFDLAQFAKWYGQAGTPLVEVAEAFDRKTKQYTLTLTQSLAPTPGQKRKQVVPIPVRIGLMDDDGNDLPLVSKSKSLINDDIVLLDKRSMTITFEECAKKPVPSILRGFSAPVNVAFKEKDKARVHRARYDSDPYNRWAALNSYATALLVKDAKARAKGKKLPVDKHFIETLVATVMDESLEPAFRAQALALPTSNDIAREIGKNVDPDAVFEARKNVQSALGKALASDGLALLKRLRKNEKTATEDQASGCRSLANTVLSHVVLAKVDGALELAQKQFKSAKNMTDRLGALSAILYCQNDTKLADAALEQMYKKFKSEPLVVDKWFTIQAAIPGKKGLMRVKKLLKHPDFSLDNPNRARSLLAPFAAGNLSGFHLKDGAGYRFYAEQILALDKLNPQIAARLLTLMNGYAMMEKGRAKHARAALQSIQSTPGLSRDVQEIVDKALA